MLKFRVKIFKGLSGNFYISDIISNNKEEILKADLFDNSGDFLNDFFDEKEIEKLKHPTAVEIDADIIYDAEEYDVEGFVSDWVSISLSNIDFYVR